MLKHKYRVMIKGYHKQNHNGFLTTIIFCRYDFFFADQEGFVKKML